MDILSALTHDVLTGDGAMGTQLIQKGLSKEQNPELWMKTNPQIILDVHRSYIQAGARIIETNTFGANSLKLAEYNAADDTAAINAQAVALAKQAAGGQGWVAGVVGPTGHFPAPLGDIPWDELADVFRVQIHGLAEAGADLIYLQTFSDLGEARAALYAARSVTRLPVACSMTYAAENRTLTGTDPATAAIVLSALGADILGINCSSGPEAILPLIHAYSQNTKLPLLAEPNAGMPILADGQTVYPLNPAGMAAYVPAFLAEGVRWMGACCGSTPAHIQALRQAVGQWDQVRLERPDHFPTRLASRSRSIALGFGQLPRLIGERINPTARKSIAQSYQEGKWDNLITEGRQQIQAGADLLDLNVGMPGMDEGGLLFEAVRRLQKALDFPLVLDCVQPKALERGLREYQGKALINSVNGEQKSLDAILPLAKTYGAAVLGLTLDDSGIPETAEGRLKIAERILEQGLKAGLAKEDILIDCLVLAAASDAALVQETLRGVRMVKEKLGLTTLLGLSNISHGLPQRSWLNQAFLAQALGAGLDGVIANPLDARIGETLAAGALLSNRDKEARHYIQKAAAAPAAIAAPAAAAASQPAAKDARSASNDPATPLEAVRAAIHEGLAETVPALLKSLAAHMSFMELIEQAILPPLEQIGEDFGCGDVFLPQLIACAEAAKAAFDYLKAAMPNEDRPTLETVVLGSVQGDVHDIGKNIVKVLLENHGYRVIDLGKNVPRQRFIDAVREENAAILGLSALMTTTMTEMEDIIIQAHAEQLPVKIIVGGAVLTAAYAEKIRADAYVSNAGQTPAVIRRLLD